jgi:hypothetical protein
MIPTPAARLASVSSARRTTPATRAPPDHAAVRGGLAEEVLENDPVRRPEACRRRGRERPAGQHRARAHDHVRFPAARKRGHPERTRSPRTRAATARSPPVAPQTARSGRNAIADGVLTAFPCLRGPEAVALGRLLFGGVREPGRDHVVTARGEVFCQARQARPVARVLRSVVRRRDRNFEPAHRPVLTAARE